MKLILPRDLRARIEDEARESAPRECCGLIEGFRENGTAHALALHPARNIAPGADRFEIDPGDHFTALKAARENGHALIGCYHSHPHGNAAPSSADRAGAGEEGFLWLIAARAATGGPVQLAGFVFRNGGFAPLEIGELAAGKGARV